MIAPWLKPRRNTREGSVPLGSSRLLEEASQEIAARDDLNWVAARWGGGPVYRVPAKAHRLRLVRRTGRDHEEARIEKLREREEIVLVGPDTVQEHKERRPFGG